ncbi:MAG: nucleotidyl transferase AbiEii/AbiGii toxin family protein, partial [Prevotellaceae bacterium]|nr:nucleotidyl transferase AbiEii/AbiGii toxin family protein [Prevotellaceae bacterium]
MNLHHNSEVFRELVELSADCFGYAQSHVEKDYWVCKILKELALSEYSGRTFFKGGTSLAKAYGLIIRFSEDLDMFVYSGNPQSSKQAEKTLNRNISHFVIENNKEMYREELSKTGGDFRKLVFSYDTHYESAGLKENLEVEIKCCTLENKSGMYYPAEKRLIEPVITEYLKEIEKQDLVNRFEIQAFEVQVVHPKRTLCDKISRLTRLSYNDDFEMQIAKHIRDVYDIYSLLTVPEYSDFIG